MTNRAPLTPESPAIGAKKAEGEEETRYAEFKRTVTLPPGVEKDKIEARYHNGILEIHLPKGPEAVGRRIEVKT